MVGHPSKINNFGAFTIFMYGIISIIFNYAVDKQKEVFRKYNGKCHIWGKPAKYLVSVKPDEIFQILIYINVITLRPGYYVSRPSVCVC